MTRIVSVITLAVLLSTVLSCTSVKEISIDEVGQGSKGKICAVVLTAMIAGLTLSSGEDVLFGEGGSVFNKRTKTISGEIEDGSFLQVELDDVKWIRLIETTIDGTESFRVDKQAFESSTRTKPWKLVDGVSVQPGETIVFDKHGGTYDSVLRVVRGVTRDGRPVALDVDDVYQYKSRQFSVEKTLVVAAFPIGIGLIIAVGLNDLSRGGIAGFD